VVAFGRCPFCNDLASVSCRLDGILHPVLQCDATGKVFSVVFEMPKPGPGALRPLDEPHHRKFAQPEVWAAGSMEYVQQFPACVIRSQCPFCSASVKVVDAVAGDLGHAIKCESTGKVFNVYFPECVDDISAPRANLLGHA
jgi:transcription elongation factor Elf1